MHELKSRIARIGAVTSPEEFVKEMGNPCWSVEGKEVILQDRGTLYLDHERNDGLPPEDEVQTFTLDDAKASIGLELFQDQNCLRSLRWSRKAKSSALRWNQRGKSLLSNSPKLQKPA
jgi:hypothetical protein